MRNTSILCLMILSIVVGYANAADDKSTPKQKWGVGRYKIIELRYDKQENITAKAVNKESSNIWKKLNLNYGVFKVDTWTGKTWVFKSVLSKDSKQLYLWVEITSGKIK